MRVNDLGASPRKNSSGVWNVSPVFSAKFLFFVRREAKII